MSSQSTMTDFGADCAEPSPDVEYCQFCNDPVEGQRKPFHLEECSEAPRNTTH